MSLLLALPAFGVILFLAKGVGGSFKQAWFMAQLQIIIAWPFLQGRPYLYLSKAFEFSRHFLYKWTVNWRFVGEDIFQSNSFSTILMVGHISTLLLFITTRWLRPAERPIIELIRTSMEFKEPLGTMQHACSFRISPNYILTVILTAIAIGMLFARSLHYQFYAYVAWATPFLLWRSGLHPILQYGLWAAQEWSWNVYPSTSISSMMVVSSLFMTIASVWCGTRKDFVVPKGDGGASKKKN